MDFFKLLNYWNYCPLLARFLPFLPFNLYWHLGGNKTHGVQGPGCAPDNVSVPQASSFILDSASICSFNLTCYTRLFILNYSQSVTGNPCPCQHFFSQKRDLIVVLLGSDLYCFHCLKTSKHLFLLGKGHEFGNATRASRLYQSLGQGEDELQSVPFAFWQIQPLMMFGSTCVFCLPAVFHILQSFCWLGCFQCQRSVFANTILSIESISALLS